ncbi:hypothetical protein SCHPADRAFT_125505 [Schizopora paradoxa]|uniref:Uncharacterized protein n=1 Tax=Schizopora paradoxa TaxID=27342 RepID=A0A0H2S1L1_9AGAM|nr:hypothetical protein SCHPADRAFT_125505 [Schizopora paradoxa]
MIWVTKRRYTRLYTAYWGYAKTPQRHHIFIFLRQEERWCRIPRIFNNLENTGKEGRSPSMFPARGDELRLSDVVISVGRTFRCSGFVLLLVIPACKVNSHICGSVPSFFASRFRFASIR